MLDELEYKIWNPKYSYFEEEEKNIKLQECKEFSIPEKGGMDLNGVWKLAHGGGEADRIRYQEEWKNTFDATVPGSVHSALYQAGAIPNPVEGIHDAQARNASYMTWWYKKCFTVDTQHSCYRELFFEGVCYKARVWLNGHYLGEHRGMFTEFSFDVAEYLQENNELVVCIENAPEKQNPHSFVMDNDSGWTEGMVINCVYGWHYACIPSRGIWKSVGLRQKKDGTWTEKPLVVTKDPDNGKVQIGIRLFGDEDTVDIKGFLSPYNFEGKSYTFTYHADKDKEDQILNLGVDIPNPKQWWPLGYGEQNLYKLVLIYDFANHEQSIEETVFGIRTIKMEAAEGQENAEEEYRWKFVVNGKPIFIKGTNWCTIDVMLDFTEEKYKRFLELAAKGNINFLRAWGGGMPESDTFYDLCNRLGIMVMQEWPTCWDSHKTQPFEELKETVEQNMARLRNHPSLIMWAGGNESVQSDGEGMEMMGRLACELDGSRPFHRTDPWGGSTHDYSTYWNMGDLDRSLELESIFLGEFGMASSPNLESVKKYVPEQELCVWPPDPLGSFLHHTPTFNQTNPPDMDYLSKSAVQFCDLTSMERFIWATQMAQTTCIRHTLESYRIRTPKATGICFYKLTDVYPACSWSVIDYYGVPKLSYYILADSFRSFHACIQVNSTRIQKGWKAPVYLLDDTGRYPASEKKVEICAFDSKLSLIAKKEYESQESADPKLYMGEFSLQENVLIPEAELEKAYEGLILIRVRTFIQQDAVDETFYWFNFQKEKDSLLSLPKTKLEWNCSNGILTIKNTGDYPAVGVTVECPEQDGRFCVEDSMLLINTKESRELRVNIEDGLRIRAFNTQE